MNAATGNVSTTDGGTPDIDSIIGEHAGGFADVTDDQDATEEGAETAQDAADESSEEEASETEADAEAEAEESEEAEETTESEATTETKGKGLDVALRKLDEIDPGLGNAVRSLQTGFNQSREEIRAQERERADFERSKAELDQLLRDYHAAEESTESESEQVDAIEAAMEKHGFTEEQKEMYRDIFGAALEQEISKRGLVSKDSLDKQESSRAQQSYVSDANRAAVETLGTAFGELEDSGALVLDSALNAPKGPHAQTLAATRDRLVAGSKGVTWADIYKVGRYDDDVKAAYEKGLAEGKGVAAKDEGVKARKKATTASSSSPASTNGRPVFKQKEGESREAVMDRILAWSRQNTV